MKARSLFTSALLLALAACGSGEKTSAPVESANGSGSVPTPSETPTPTPPTPAPSTPTPDPTPTPTPSPTPIPTPQPQPQPQPQPDPIPPQQTNSECNDGIDNDADGLIDWQYDLGCHGATDTTERALSRSEENGWTTFDVGTSSRIVYVSSSSGNDANDGTSPDRAVRTIARGASLIRDGQNDFLLLKRGDSWQENGLGRFVNGTDAAHPVVVSTYGNSTQRPIIRSTEAFIDLGAQKRSHVAVMGLELVNLLGDPTSPSFTGNGDAGGIVLVGDSDGYLIEDVKVSYGKLNAQGWNHAGTGVIRNAEFRRNVVQFAYSNQTCSNAGGFRPSGSYTEHVDGLLIEDNIYDHNGWNEQVSGACATMLNHNFYLNAKRATVRNNIITRGSSMGIKLSGFGPGEEDGRATINDFVIDNNFIFEGELGISAGGNGRAEYRFSDMRITDNVFSQVGRSNPTGRSLSWMLDISDHDTSVIEGNYFLSQPWFTNSFGIRVGEDYSDRANSARALVIRNNVFYGLQGPELIVWSKPSYVSVAVQSNTIIDTQFQSCLVDHRGAFTNISYSNNRYQGVGSGWFCVDGASRTLAQWRAASGESSATAFSQSFVAPNRTLDSYAKSIGFESDYAYIDSAKHRSRLNWDLKFTANAVNTYIKAGFATN